MSRRFTTLSPDARTAEAPIDCAQAGLSRRPTILSPEIRIILCYREPVQVEGVADGGGRPDGRASPVKQVQHTNPELRWLRRKMVDSLRLKPACAQSIGASAVRASGGME